MIQVWMEFELCGDVEPQNNRCGVVGLFLGLHKATASLELLQK
jgi:hypothetical protein